MKCVPCPFDLHCRSKDTDLLSDEPTSVCVHLKVDGLNWLWSEYPIYQDVMLGCLLLQAFPEIKEGLTLWYIKVLLQQEFTGAEIEILLFLLLKLEFCYVFWLNWFRSTFYLCMWIVNCVLKTVMFVQCTVNWTPWIISDWKNPARHKILTFSSDPFTICLNFSSSCQMSSWFLVVWVPDF